MSKEFDDALADARSNKGQLDDAIAEALSSKDELVAVKARYMVSGACEELEWFVREELARGTELWTLGAAMAQIGVMNCGNLALYANIPADFVEPFSAAFGKSAGRDMKKLLTIILKKRSEKKAA